MFDPHCGEGQILELARGDLATFEGLRQQTVVVGDCGNMAGVIVPILIVQFTGSYFLVLIFFVVMAMLLAIFSSLIDYRERGLA